MQANDCSDTGEHGCEFVAVVANHNHNKGDCCSSKTHHINSTRADIVVESEAGATS
jgi:hypothetical protein